MQFKVGDRVVIREWDDMAQEYGLNSFGFIKVRFSFTDDMRYLCGRKAIISGIDLGGHIHFENNVEGEWAVSADMLKLAGGQLEFDF